MVWLKTINNQSYIYNQRRGKISRGNGTLSVLSVEMEIQGYMSGTWKVIGWEWILHLIDVGLKLVNFELKMRHRTIKPKTLV